MLPHSNFTEIDRRWRVGASAPAHVRSATTYWSWVEALFHEADGRPPEDRFSFLMDWTDGDAETVAEVLSLLESSSELKKAVAGVAISAHSDGPELSAEQWKGRRVGRYELDSLLGRGGMGVVYLAHRADESDAPAVALKMISESLRMDHAVLQFEEERQTLARLQHPHIARLLDGGIFRQSSGAPPQSYLVMEYVSGLRLDAYCDQPSITSAEVFRLFLQLCDAVAYVHRNLLLHRDLKPSNVLVTEDGDLKLLDFGAIEAISSDEDSRPEGWLRAITLNYTSPETLTGEPLTVAADVYSLGRLLERLLSGDLRAPHLQREREDAGQRRSVRPELVLSGGKQLREHQLRDLEAVLYKATAYEAGERYRSVDAFAEEIKRVQSNRPVAARPQTRRYLAACFLRRNRKPILLAGVALAASLCGAAVARREYGLSVDAYRRTQNGLMEQQALAHTLLLDYIEKLRDIPGSMDAQRQTVDVALKYLDDLVRAVPHPSADLSKDEVRAYTRLGQLLGSPYEQNLGDADGARKALHKAIEIGRASVAESPHDLQAMMLLISAELELGRVEFGLGNARTAMQLLQPAVQVSERIATDSRSTASMIAEVVPVLETLGDVYDQPGVPSLNDPEHAIYYYRLALQYHLVSAGMDPSCVRCVRGVALDYWKMGLAEESSSMGAALRDSQAGLAVLDRLTGQEQKSMRTQRLRQVLQQRVGFLQVMNGRAEEGRDLLAKVADEFREEIHRDPHDDRARFDLCALLPDLEDAEEATHQWKQAMQTQRELVQDSHALVAHEPANEAYRGLDAIAHLNLARMEETASKDASALSDAKAGMLLAGPLIGKESAPPDLVSTVVSTLLHQPGIERDVSLALTIARKNIERNASPDDTTVLAFADAEAANGMHNDSRKRARAILAHLPPHPLPGRQERLYETALRLAQ